MLRNGVRYLLARLPYRPAFRQTQVSPPFPTAGFDPTAVYIASDRRRFYRAIGIFCIFQASGWGFFTAYVARKSEVNWDTLVADVDWLNRRIAQRLESLTPSALKQLILRPRPGQEKAESKPGVTAAGGAADVVTPNAETSTNKNDDEKSKDESSFGQSLVSTAKDVSTSFRLSLGLSEDKKTVKLSTTSLLPLLTGLMCEFCSYLCWAAALVHCTLTAHFHSGLRFALLQKDSNLRI
ncbi:unnamed protein product [Dibothriocephalus latus]|uniref:Uncharacterized protein n=1 Tax=Dibothriocephalus latus TaxID=60516 RepID=A0A3P6QFK5_DIBLA|nr:unnamed protein product [Dibothriocephalus latus]